MYHVRILFPFMYSHRTEVQRKHFENAFLGFAHVCIFGFVKYTSRKIKDGSIPCIGTLSRQLR